MRKSDLEAIAEVIRGTDIIVISDEIYSELTYGDEEHCSIVEIDGMKERTVLINGFSKAFSMTGWRFCRRSRSYSHSDAEDSPVRHNVFAHNEPVCRSNST